MTKSLTLSTCLLCLTFAGAALAQDPCSGFAWNVSAERAVFASAQHALPAGKDLASAPSLQLSQLYRLQLTPQPAVSFALPPGKKMLTDGAYAGLARLRVAAAGIYRVSIDGPFWIDLVANAALLPTVDFQGSNGCEAPRKIVEFSLPPNTDLVLQLSAATQARVHVAITLTSLPLH